MPAKDMTNGSPARARILPDIAGIVCKKYDNPLIAV